MQSNVFPGSLYPQLKNYAAIRAEIAREIRLILLSDTDSLLLPACTREERSYPEELTFHDMQYRTERLVL